MRSKKWQRSTRERCWRRHGQGQRGGTPVAQVHGHSAGFEEKFAKRNNLILRERKRDREQNATWRGSGG